MAQAQRKGEQRRRSVLVVDDHLDTAQSLALLLRDMGHRVEFAINGRSALALMDKFRPEVVFLDMLLPDFDGSDLCGMLRGKAEPARLSVYAVTGQGDDDTRRRAEQAGCDAFLLKPLDPARIEQLLARA